MDHSPDGVQTDLIDLTDLSISAVLSCDDDLLAPSMKRVLIQVERPRANIGSGPPGRAD